MSLTGSNRSNWLRPFGSLFVLASIFVLTLVISPVSTVITSKYSADINWNALNENFPATMNGQNPKEIIPFFFARGQFESIMNLTSDFIAEIQHSTTSSFHLTFDIWRNAKICAKYFSLTPDAVPDLHDGVWTTFDRQYPNNAAFRNFSMWLSAGTRCEDSLVAIRNLKLSYKTSTGTEVKKMCTPERKQDCFVDKILNEPFHFLPKNFPIIGKDRTGRELFYAIKSDSKLTITVDDPDKYWAKAPENDVCLRFKYFVATQARLSLRINDQIDLWRIDGIESASHNQTGIELSKEVNVCVKALLPLDKLKNMTNFQLSFVSQTDNLNEAVAVELLKVDGHYLHTTNNLHIPVKSLRYLSNENKNLKEPPSGVDRLSYQWTANFPDNRWTEPDHSSIQLLRQETGTIESAYLESAWIERLVQTSSSPVYLNFKVEVDLRNELRNDFTGTVYLIDSDRKRLTSFEAKFTQKNIPESIKVEPVPAPSTKSHTFSISLNVNIEFGKMFKVQFHIRFQDNMKPIATTLPEVKQTGFLLKISEINFGDPCINSPRAVPQHCYGIIEGMHEVDPMTRCIRNEQSNGGMSYSCNCAHESLSGINCEKIDFCKFKHEIKVTHPFNPMQINTNTGKEFCAQKDNIATCKRGRFESHQFVCECNNKTHFSFDWYNKKCEPIDQCILNPCNLETEMCVQKNDNGVLKSDCSKCMPGYARNAIDAPCVAITNEDENCDLKMDCNHDPNDTLMKCIAGPYELKMCVCPKGFRRDDTSPSGISCKSAYCDFPGLHKCFQKCTNIEMEPYYQCSCEDHYERDAEKCTLKANAPVTCQECKDAKYKVCKNGKCSCIDNFVESGNDCVPSANYQLKGCPFGQTKIDPIDGSLVCDCSNKTSGYFTDDTTVQKTCRLSKTICDSGERGQSLCASRDSACLLDPLHLEEHSCQCNLGKLFPDGRRMKKASELRSNHEVMCVDVCDLPYKRNQCASIGAKCNPAKLLSAIVDIEPTIINIRSIPTEKYCECVTGTFYDFYIEQCVQELESLSLNLTFRWTHELERHLNDILNMFVGFGGNQEINLPEEFVSLENSFSFVDPIDFAHSLIRIKRANLETDAKTIKEWKQLTRKMFLLTRVEDLLYSFNLIDHHSKYDRTDVKEIGRDVQIVSIHEQILDGKPNYVLKLAVKISAEIQESGTVMYSTGSSVGLPNNLPNFQIIMDSCHVFKNKDNCVIPYMSVVLATSNSTIPVLNEPCTNADTCHGMSNCIPKTGSQFACECDLKHFEVEDANSFAAKSNGSLVVLKNDRCKAKL